MPVTETIRAPWSKPQPIVSSDDTLPAATTSKFANIPSNAYKPTSTQNALEVCFTLGADAQNCVAYLYAARKNGDICLAWTGTITAGTQVSTDGRYYADTVASSTTDLWYPNIREIDGGGNNRVFRIRLDTCGYMYFYCLFTGLSSESVRPYYSGF